MGMNKKSNKQKVSDSSDSSNQVYEVEKIVNQRVINGKKQYKVIWVGYSFDQATWEPQENLNCPQKIEEFLRRYQDVIRRKMMGKQMPLNASQSIPKPNINNLTQKPLNFSQAKPQQLISIQNPLNKQKLQQSIQKSTVLPKNIPVNDSRPKLNSIVTKKQNDRILQENNFTQNQKVNKQPIQPSKVIQIKQNSIPVVMNSKKEPINNSVSNKVGQKIVQENNQQSTENTASQQQKVPNTFLAINQRLEIIQILGMVQFEQGEQAMFFLIKNKFEKEEKLVERERILDQAPQKLIQFYENLIETS